jgi:SAM-dependent methyltransferase
MLCCAKDRDQTIINIPATRMHTMDAISLETVPCPLGCDVDDTWVVTGSDLLHDLPGSFSIVKCRTCGLMRTNPRPTPLSIGYYYPDDYGPYMGTRVGQVTGSQLPRRESPFKRLLKRVIASKAQALPPVEPSRMLEIGCASGAFLHKMAVQGWKVQGIEFSSTAAEAAARLGHTVHVGPLETAPEPEEPFDLIVGWMVLEHLHDPVMGLRKLRDWAKADAWLAVSVPNAGSCEFRLFGRRWFALHLPNHLYHFSPRTLEKVLDAGGWKLDSVHHQRVLGNFVVSLGYVLRDWGFSRLSRPLINVPARVEPILYLALFPLAWLLSLFGQTGRMTVWARVKP